MASVIVAKKWKATLFVVSAYRVHKEAILDGIVWLGRDPEGSGVAAGVGLSFFFPPAARSPEEMRAAVGVFLDHVFDTLEHRAYVLIDADHAKLREVDTEFLTRIERTRIARELRDQYIRQRNAFVNLFDEHLALLVGFEVVTETDPVMLMFQVRRVVDCLMGGRVSLGETFAGVEIDPAPYGRALEPKLKKLESNVHQVNYDEHTTQGQLRLKNLAMEALDELYGPAVRLLEAAFLLAGMPELAELVKPPRRRAGRRGEELLAEEVEGSEAEMETPDFSLLGIDEPLLPGEADTSSEEPGGEPGEAPEGEDPRSDG